jgi:hypothetical protein
MSVSGSARYCNRHSPASIFAASQASEYTYTVRTFSPLRFFTGSVYRLGRMEGKTVRMQKKTVKL